MSSTTKKLILVCGFLSIVLLTVYLMLRHPQAVTSLQPSPAQTFSIQDYTGFTETDLASDSSWIESTASVHPDTACVNTETFSCTLVSGGALSVGYEDLNEDGCILLNPAYSPSPSEPDSEYGIYVRTDCGRISLLLTETHEPAPAGCSVFSGMTYDTAVPVFPDTVRFIPPAGVPDGDLCVYLRVVRLADYCVTGTAVCTLSFDEGSCRITSLSPTDVSQTGEMDSASRSLIIRRAIGYILDSGRGPVFSSSGEFQTGYIEYAAVVERCSATYFPGLPDSSGNYIRSGTLSRMDLTAVSLPLPGAGNVTVYLAPELQLEGYSISSAFFIEDSGPVPFAYDFLYPFTEDTLLVPDAAINAYNSCRSSFFHEVCHDR